MNQDITQHGHDHRTEVAIYTTIWVVIAGVYLILGMRGRAQLSLPLLDWRLGKGLVATMAPYLILFLVNNCILIPRLLLRNKLPQYCICALVVLVLLWTYLYIGFEHKTVHVFRPRPEGVMPPPHVRLLPLPLLLDFTYGILVIGCNVAVALVLRRYDESLEHERLLRANDRTQLEYLKAQINPHFYMNMLNNIHACIDIDKDAAQRMVIGLSKLMRYMLYESARTSIPLSSEISFVKTYMELMKMRYDSERLHAEMTLPSDGDIAGVKIPPLLFLVFIENAFKHGVSYREPSFVRVEIATSGNRVTFSCINSKHPKSDATTGIGLRNVAERLRLLYDDKAILDIDNSATAYAVHLEIPVYETENDTN